MPLKYEDEVIAAVKKLAHSVNSDGKAADLSSLIDITSRLPLTNLESWESLLRWQFIRTEECSSSSFRWKFWSKPQPRPKPAPPLTWIDICNRDGFKREKALRSLSGAAPNSFFFALVTRRLNDWVPQVRCAARESLPAIAQASDPEHVVDVLCIILPHWNSWGRMEDADKQVILDTISLKKVAHALKLRIISTASGPMTSILAQTGRTAVLDSHLDEIAQKAIQPAVRAKAYRCQLEGKMVWFAGKNGSGQINLTVRDGSSQYYVNALYPLPSLLKKFYNWQQEIGHQLFGVLLEKCLSESCSVLDLRRKIWQRCWLRIPPLLSPNEGDSS